MSDTLPPTRRRWCRFSLRTMFVVVTALAIGLGILISGERWLTDQFIEAYRRDAERGAKRRAAWQQSLPKSPPATAPAASTQP